MAKKSDKALQDLANELKKLRKENEKLAKTVGTMREEQAEYNRKVLALIEERLVAPDPGAGDAGGHAHDENGGFVTAGTAGDGDNAPEPSAEARQDHQQEPQITGAANRRAKGPGVDPTSVRRTWLLGGRVLVRDVEAAAGQ